MKGNNTQTDDFLPPKPKLNSFQSIMRLKPRPGSEFCVNAFVLNRDIVNEDGTLDDLNSVIFPLGSFSTEEEAVKHAKNVIEMTGHPGVIAARYAAAVPLTTKYNPENIEEVKVDNKGRLLKLEDDQYKRECQEYEERRKRAEEIEKEAEEETNPDSIEHFKRMCYLTVKHRATQKYHENQVKIATENYQKRLAQAKEHYKRHPEHEEQWLPYFKKKLEARGELDLYLTVEAGYKQLRDEIVEKKEEIECECPGGVCLGLSNNIDHKQVEVSTDTQVEPCYVDESSDSS